MPVADPCRTNMVLDRIRAICRRFPPSEYKGTKSMAAEVGRTQSSEFAPRRRGALVSRLLAFFSRRSRNRCGSGP